MQNTIFRHDLLEEPEQLGDQFGKFPAWGFNILVCSLAHIIFVNEIVKGIYRWLYCYIYLRSERLIIVVTNLDDSWHENERNFSGQRTVRGIVVHS